MCKNLHCTVIKGSTLSSKYGTVPDYETIENFHDLKKFAN